jgi:AraC-like DNA-binding protein
MISNGLLGPFLFTFLTGILGLAVSMILFFSHNEKSLGNRLLSLSIFSISYVLLINASFLTNFYQYFPFTYRLFSFITFCIGPFSYLYIRTVLRQEYRLSKTDYLFFTPALIGLLNRIPFSLLTKQEQIEIINNINQNLKLVVLESEGWLPAGQISMIRIVITLGFIIAQVVLISRWKRKMQEKHIYIQQNNEIVRWLELYSTLLLLSVSILFVQTFLQVSLPFHLEKLIIFTMGLTNLVTSIMLLARPRILYGLVGWMQEPTPVVSVKDISVVEAAPITEENKKSSLSILEGRNYKELIENHLTSNTSYLNAGYTINDLSRELKIPVYQLSLFINQEYQKSFVQYINDARFNYLLELQKTDPDFDQYTIDFIGRKIGFNSRTSFVDFIKKRTGKTPSEFLREN